MLRKETKYIKQIDLSGSAEDMELFGKIYDEANANSLPVIDACGLIDEASGELSIPEGRLLSVIPVGQDRGPDGVLTAIVLGTLPSFDEVLADPSARAWVEQSFKAAIRQKYSNGYRFAASKGMVYRAPVVLAELFAPAERSGFTSQGKKEFTEFVKLLAASLKEHMAKSEALSKLAVLATIDNVKQALLSKAVAEAGALSALNKPNEPDFFAKQLGKMRDMAVKNNTPTTYIDNVIATRDIVVEVEVDEDIDTDDFGF